MVLFVAFGGLDIYVFDSVIRKFVSSFILMGGIPFTVSEEMVWTGVGVGMEYMATTNLVRI